MNFINTTFQTNYNKFYSENDCNDADKIEQFIDTNVTWICLEDAQAFLPTLQFDFSSKIEINPKFEQLVIKIKSITHNLLNGKTLSQLNENTLVNIYFNLEPTEWWRFSTTGKLLYTLSKNPLTRASLCQKRRNSLCLSLPKVIELTKLVSPIVKKFVLTDKKVTLCDLDKIFQTFSRLIKLKLIKCEFIHDQNEEETNLNFPITLQSLDLSRSCGLSKRFFKTVPHTLKSLNLSSTKARDLVFETFPDQLEIAHFNECHWLPTSVIHKLPNSMKSLSLQLRNVRDIIKLPQLSSLDLSGCTDVTENFIKILPLSLITLNLSWCGITDEFIMLLPSLLKSLNFSACYNLSDNAFSVLPIHLAFLDVTLITNLKKETIMDLKQKISLVKSDSF